MIRGQIVVVGDCTLDVTVAGAALLRRGRDGPADITLAPGGQAANVAVRLARRGLDVRLLAPVGEDAAGRILRDAMAAERVELVALPTPRTAVVIVILDRDGERSMASARVSLEATAVGVALGGADGAAWVHCSGYALLDDATGDELARALGTFPAPVHRSVAGGSIPDEPDRVARLRGRLGQVRPHLLVVNRDEAAAILGASAEDPAAAARGLAGLADVVVVTAGGDGSAAVVSGQIVSEPAPNAPGEPVDATGAGDAYTAALIAELLGIAWPPGPSVLRDAMLVAGELGGRVARETGAQARVSGEAPR